MQNDFIKKEISDFIKDNIDLVENDQWKKLLKKAANTKGILLAELIYYLVRAEIDTNSNSMTTSLSRALNDIVAIYKVVSEAV